MTDNKYIPLERSANSIDEAINYLKVMLETYNKDKNINVVDYSIVPIEENNINKYKVVVVLDNKNKEVSRTLKK